MVGDILDDNKTYHEFPKHVFIQKLGHAMNEFISSGDDFLLCHEGVCRGECPNKGLTGFSFIGNQTRKFIDLIFEIKEGRVFDICECRCFKNYGGDVEKTQRVLVDRYKEDYIFYRD